MLSKPLKMYLFLSKNFFKRNPWKNVGLIRRPPKHFLCYYILEDPGSSNMGGGGYTEFTNVSKILYFRVFPVHWYIQCSQCRCFSALSEISVGVSVTSV